MRGKKAIPLTTLAKRLARLNRNMRSVEKELAAITASVQETEILLQATDRALNVRILADQGLHTSPEVQILEGEARACYGPCGS